MDKSCFFFLLAVVLQLYYIEPCTAANIHTDQSALLALKASISLNFSHPLAQNWSSQASVCDWIGVTCGSRHYRVASLNISNMVLTGPIPHYVGNLTFLVSLDLTRNNFYGMLPQEMSRLHRLKFLRLSYNNFSGEIPSWFGLLAKLQVLTLGNNSFTGSIPSSLSNISNLARLDLSFNFLQGNIPNWIGDLHSLYWLGIHTNQLTGSIPLSIFNISTLETIALSQNGLSGDLPADLCDRLPILKGIYLSSNKMSGQMPLSLSRCYELQVLSLSENEFTGVISENIGNLRNLQQLLLDNNHIVGRIPRTISNMSSLRLLYLGTNNLTGIIPREIVNLHKLEILDLQVNKLSGSIPEGLFNISTLRWLSLAFNNLSGSLPSTSGYWQTNMQLLNLGANNIGGVIPSSISNSSNLNSLYLSENKFSGSIPKSLGDLKQLENLWLHRNNLTSPHLSIFTSLVNCRSLKKLVLNNNPLKGVLPDSIGNLSISLEQFYVSSSEIRGQIPLGIGNLSNLNILSLDGNDLTGSVPKTFFGLHNLQVLDLAQNRLSGPLPECLCELPELSLVSLSDNQISGSIPNCIGNVTSLREFHMGSNRLTEIPMSLWSLKDLLKLDLSNNSLNGSLPPDFGNLNAITYVDLSRNNLSGSIPTTVGNMQKLIYLSMAYNELQGSIPESLQKMISLESMNLSNNILTGMIPKSLEVLRYLKYFNVSFNSLEGEIPSKGPFLNFTSQSFMGNEALCGGLLFPPCKAESSHESRRRRVLLIVLVSLGASLMVLGSIFLFVSRRYRNRKNPIQAESLPRGTTLARISYIEIERATQGFDQCNFLGCGGFGSVYKGVFGNGMVLAIKVFNLQIEGAFKSFDSECNVLRNIRHRNLTKVISSCSNMDFKALLLEYMPNGSLEKWLHSDGNFLNIIQRFDIMIDVASALEYLHHGYSTIIVHSDLKPSNILLDEKLIGHVSDFGMAKLLGEGESIAHTKTLATMGYIAPEHGSAGLVSTSCDVYSYGIMLMETFTRKKPCDEMFQENMTMRSWICNSLPAAPEDIIDVTLLEPNEIGFNKRLHCVSSVLELALSCTTDSPNDRPDMKDVLANIKKIKLECLSR